MYGKSIENTYQLISGKATFEEIMTYLSCLILTDQYDDSMIPTFFIEPGAEPTIDEVDDMITYFERLEDYEKCKFLIDFKDKL